MLGLQVTSETCEEFLKTLYHEICIDKDDILYKQIILIQGEQTFEAVREGFGESNRNHEETHRKLDHVIEGIDNINEKINGIGKCGAKHDGVPIVNRADEYAKKWNENVFLNDFDEEDENACVNIKLSDIYIEECLPHYIWKINEQSKATLRNFLAKYINNINEKKMLLILGQAGIGKSTLITWIMANLVEKEEDILVYQFASDLGSVNWQDDNILDEIFKMLGLRYDELENKVIIIDGFDEIRASSSREKILNQIYYSLKEMNYLKHVSLIITCRKNYIEELKKVRCDYITLQTWDNDQIISFCEIYGSISKRRILQNALDMMLENKSVFGIPLILYIVLALDISIERNASLVNIYDKIFAVDGGGIYDRCINNLSYGKEHRIGEVKQQIHQVSQKIAFWMFENNSEKATIPQIKFKKICDIVMKEVKGKAEDIQSDVLIGSYFETIRHCEGLETDELQFVHRSIYEYFVVVYFFESIRDLKSKEEVAGKLGELLKYGYLTEQILRFIEYKFESVKNCDLAKLIRETFKIMVRDGMTYHTKKCYKNIIEREMNVFFNMINLVYLWNLNIGELDYKINNYLRYDHRKIIYLHGVELRAIDLPGVCLSGGIFSSADLSRANLEGADLSKIKLVNANLSKANLSKANLIKANLGQIDLTGADLSGTNLAEADLICANLKKAELSGADLKKAILVSAHLEETNLTGADLEGANLLGAHLEGANLFRANIFGISLEGADINETLFDESQVELLCKKYDLNCSRVFIAKSKEIISYKDYCIRKKKKGI